MRSVADGVIRSASMLIVDRNTGRTYTTAAEAPPGADLAPESPYQDWRYWNGVLNVAMRALGEELGDTTYKAFNRRNVSFGFDSYERLRADHKGQDKWVYPFRQFFIMKELDDCGAMGASVIEVFADDKQVRYRDYIEWAATHIRRGQDRMADGTFVRSFPHKWTLWADDLYMGLSFLSRYGAMTGDRSILDDAARQVVQFHKYLFDDTKDLMRHCWYEDVQRPGVAFWGRANGWALVAQVELLDRLPKDHPERDTLLALFRRHALGVAKYQEPDGLWHQLLDKKDSYLETSCSAMFTYAIARAVRNGYLDALSMTIAERGWEGVMSRIREDGRVEGVCTGAVVSDDLAYYYRRPAPLNDVHGIGTILMAGAEMIHAQKTKNSGGLQ